MRLSQFSFTSKLIVTVGLLLILLLGLSYNLWHSLIKKNTLSLESIHQVQIYLSDAHLLFEKTTSGDLSINTEDIWQSLEKIDTRLQTILRREEVRSALSIFLREGISLRGDIVRLKTLIPTLERVIHQHWEDSTVHGESLYSQNIHDTYNAALLLSIKIAHDIQDNLSVKLEEQQRVEFLFAFLAMLLLIYFTLKIESGSSKHKRLEQQIILEKADHEINVNKRVEELTGLTNEIFSQKIAMDAHSLVSITDVRGNILYVNDKFCAVSGYSREELVGADHKILNSGNQPKGYWKQMYLDVSKGNIWGNEVRNKSKNGEFYWVETTILPKYDEANKLNGYISIRTDITKTKEQQKQLRLMAHYDVLTGLPNRALFSDRFTQAIAHSKRTKRQLAICFLDLDNFKPVNDNYGHEAGDELLIKVAKRIIDTIRSEDTVSRQVDGEVEVASSITDSLRNEDTVSRQGGDEFALLLNDIESYSQCEQVIQRIHNALALPFVINGHFHSITASSGTTLYPFDDGDIDTLLRHADKAMYQAKLAGKNRFHLYSPEQDKCIIQKHHQLEEIEHALTNNDFQLYYQPKVNMVTGEVFGVEALIRWIHPEKGLIPPLDFLPALGSTALEIKVGNWVINEALTQLENWNNQGIQLEVSINISSYHLLSDSFLGELKLSFDRHPSIDAHCLQLEILESSALGDLNAISTIIQSCQSSLGVMVALDDFGTGYSSLTHLRNLSVDTIKIDQSFVKNMLNDPNDCSIIEGIIGLANAFGREVIAEGVETTNHGLMLLTMGCEDVQGYCVAKPIPANEFSQWLQDYHPNQDWLQYGNNFRSAKEKK